LRPVNREEVLDNGRVVTARHARDDLKQSLRVITYDHAVVSGRSVLGLADRPPSRSVIATEQGNFEGKLVEDTVIAAPIDIVREALIAVCAWPRFLWYVHDVKVTYDDGIYQELVVDLDRGDGNSFSTRLIRRCDPSHIAYFRPEPAGFLKYHCGDWFFRPLTKNVTLLTIVQRWTCSAKAGLMFPNRNAISSEQQVSATLRQQASLALATWKHCLERGVA
jgi:hypothetical protein